MDQDDRQPRARPLLTASVAPDVRAAVCAIADERREPLSYAVERVLRAGLAAMGGLPTKAA